MREHDIDNLLSVIECWLDDHPDSNFDSGFVEELREKFEQAGDLSDRQIAALENIIDRWHMDE